MGVRMHLCLYHLPYPCILCSLRCPSKSFLNYPQLLLTPPICGREFHTLIIVTVKNPLHSLHVNLNSSFYAPSLVISIILHSHLKTLKIPAVNIFVDQLKNVTFSKITGLYGSYDNKENSFFKQ